MSLTNLSYIIKYMQLDPYLDSYTLEREDGDLIVRYMLSAKLDEKFLQWGFPQATREALKPLIRVAESRLANDKIEELTRENLRLNNLLLKYEDAYNGMEALRKIFGKQ